MPTALKWLITNRLSHKFMMAIFIAFRRRYLGFTALFFFLCFLLLQYNIIYNQYEELTNFNVIGWEYNRSRSAKVYILPSDVTTLISSRTVCTGPYPPRVLLIVCSSTENFALRTAIRETWAHSAHEKFNVSIAFFMGVSEKKQINDHLKQESDNFNDIIIEDFVDTYNNLTIKTLMLLKWVKYNCNSTGYVMKTDDDVYINVKNLALFVNRIPEASSRDILCGRLLCSAKPVSDPTNKWYMPTYLYALELYPDYLEGFCYLMSASVALSLYDEAYSVPIVHIEDVFLTGLCADRMGIKPSEHVVFKVRKAEMKRCSVEDKYLIIHSHKISTEEMYLIHETISNCNFSNVEKWSFYSWLFKRGKSLSEPPFNPNISMQGADELSYCSSKL